MSFCGRCPCRIDMKCKPGRCGVNMWMLCDVRIWCVNIYMTTRLCHSCQQRILGYASHVDNEYSAMPVMSTTNTRLCHSCQQRILGYSTYVDNEYSARPIMAKMDTLPGAIRPRRKKNSYVLHRTQFPVYHTRKNHERKTLFIKELSLQMVKPWIEQRMFYGMTGIQRNVLNGYWDSNLLALLQRKTSSKAETTPIYRVLKRHTVHASSSFARCIL
ncbi:UvrABC system protein [Trichinella pseudospiralis]